MDDPHGTLNRDCDNLEQRSAKVGTDGEQLGFTVVLALNKPDRIAPCVHDVRVRDAMSAGAGQDVHVSTMY